MTETSVQCGMIWSPSGTTILRGATAAALDAIDAAIVAWAAAWSPEPVCAGPLLPTEVGERVGYLDSFPHLAAFVVGHPNVGDHGARESSGGRSTGVGLPGTMLGAAACHHVYAALRDSVIPGPMVFSIRAPCVRRESDFLPLRRQLSFALREIVMVGDHQAVTRFLSEVTVRCQLLFERLGLTYKMVPATDPFFGEERGKRLMQLIEPNKWEFVVAETALASLNAPRTHFGEGLNIRCDGRPIHSACLGFGLERWLHALVARFGDAPAILSMLSEMRSW